MSALVDGFQYFWRFHRLVKLAVLLKIAPPSACALPRFGGAGLFVRNLPGFSNPLTLSKFLFNKKTSA